MRILIRCKEWKICNILLHSDTQALHDMLKMITEHHGHIDFIIESNQAERFKRWTIVYTSTVDLSFRCPESCYIFYQ